MPASISPPARSQATVREVLRRWRLLTGGEGVRDADRPTVAACSGGADSSALVLALSAAPAPVVVAHIAHGVRPREEVERDREAASGLASALGLPFDSADVCAFERENVEASLRRARYDALADVAERHGCVAVATGHHADDQAETVMMRLLRGAGPRGLRGILPRRRLRAGVDVVRPMLGVRRADARALCESCGWAWTEDATNADVSRLRAAVRARVMPALEAVSPGAIDRMTVAAAVQHDADLAIRRRAEAVIRGSTHDGDARVWPREKIAREPVVVIGAISRSIGGSASGRTGDRWRQAVALSRALQDGDAGVREIALGGAVWRVDAHTAVCSRRG